MDCGGGACPKCADTKNCALAGDCLSGVCTAGVCQAPTCTDGVHNGTETAVDCGGLCAPPTPWYLDKDNDGYGAGAAATACAAPGPKYVTKKGDCADGDPSAYPGAPEIWGDCVDQNCDGVDNSVGSGSDGDLTVSGTTTLSPSSTTLAVSAIAGSKQIQVASASGLAAGRLVLIRAAAGTSTLVGQFEMAEVDSVSSTTLTLRSALNNSYSASDTVRVTTVPQYKTVTVKKGGTLTVGAWSGAKGGVLALVVSGKFTVESGGKVSAATRGYRGGARSLKAKVVGQQGESHKGVGARTTSANLSGGGGGKAPSLGHACGGGGGYGTAGAVGGVNKKYPAAAGHGGGTAGTAALAALLFGGAGGSGGLDADPGPGAYGGLGGQSGGAVVVVCDTLALAGTVDASGGNGEHGKCSGYASPGGGGGGAGGSVLLVAGTVESATGSLMARGGNGGKGSEAGSLVTYGGRGGYGRIRVLATSAVPATPKAYTSCP